MTGECVFCAKSGPDIIAENELAKAFYDQFPVNEGHVLIVPKRHVTGCFEATPGEISAINELVFGVKDILDSKYKPDGYNIGVNVGYAAGQTIFHLHMHVIPRYDGDVADPRGGIRRIKKSIVPYAEEGE
ncbi:MAG: HIT family protein [Firmicutes bacterium]|nr:HIT family protein [Bacillota bacterium]